MLLSREVRFALNGNYDNAVTNSWAAWPATLDIAPHLKLTCVVQGEPDPTTGYICNIKELDGLLRTVITQHIIPDYQSNQGLLNLTRLMYEHCKNLWNGSAAIFSMTLASSEFLKASIYSQQESMIELTQQFEFSAAHRLHCDDLTTKQNLEVFGKCNNLEGHGHNYVLEVSLAGEPDENGHLISLHDFEATVKEKIIDRLDHKHLNRDVDYFSKVNPSVENMSKAIWNWLFDEFTNAKLSKVKLYETPKTWAEYSG
ncbi:MAG: 6-carboxytetrahydropterin synthase [Planctomycetota bacterium]